MSIHRKQEEVKMKPYFFVLTCNTAKKLSGFYTNVLRALWGGDCVILVYDSDHQDMADEAKSLGYRVEVFDWISTTSSMSGPGWTSNYAKTKRVVSPARYATYEIARRLGIRFFMQLDDDVTYIQIPKVVSGHLPKCDKRITVSKNYPFAMQYVKDIIESTFDFVEKSGCIVAFVQTGELMSADASRFHFKPKVMNTFILDTENPVDCFGGINEDVNIYTRRFIPKPCFQIAYLTWHHEGSQLNYRAGADYKGTWEKHIVRLFTTRPQFASVLIQIRVVHSRI